MAFPTTGILDDFNRADEGPPPSANWTDDLTGSSGDALAVVSNQCKNVSGIGARNGWWNAATFTDSEIYYDLATSLGTNYLDLRVQSPGTSNFSGYANVITASDSKIYRIDNNSFTQLGSTATVTYSIGDTAGFEANGSTFTAHRKTGGSWTSNATSSGDTTYGSGYLAVQLSRDMIIDNFGGGTITVGGPTNTVAPAVTGTVQVGQTLTCSTGSWDY